MSTLTTSNRAGRRREPAPEANRLDRALRLYRWRIGRCRTENRVNRVHIALANYMTPAEVRYFAAALAQDAADSPSRRWIATLEGSMPVKTGQAGRVPAKGVAERRVALRRERRSHEREDADHRVCGYGHHRLMARRRPGC